MVAVVGAYRVTEAVLSDSGGEAEGPDLLPVLDDDTPLYRALLYSNWFKGGTVKKAAFFRRSPKPDTGEDPDPDGLSVSLRDNRGELETCEEEAQNFNECFGFCRIFHGHVCELGYKTVPDTRRHANIEGLPRKPFGSPTTPEGKAALNIAETAGSDLARHAVIVWPIPAS